MMFSNTAMIVDSAAKNRNRKKKLPKIRPPFIEVKMCGSVIKISFGPLSGCTLIGEARRENNKTCGDGYKRIEHRNIDSPLRAAIFLRLSSFRKSALRRYQGSA